MNTVDLRFINLPYALRFIGKYVFYRCGFDDIIIPSNVEVIDQGTFQESNISEITITNDRIGAYQFYGCDYLEKVDVHSEVLTIGYAAFGACTSLEELVIPFVGNNFNDTEGLTGEKKLLGYIFGSNQNEGSYAVVQHYLEKQDNNTFVDRSVTSYIPSSLRKVTVYNDTQISYGAFMGCSSWK